MASAVGTNVALGTANEVTYGTFVAPDSWTEILSESVALQQIALVSQGRRTGQSHLRRGSRRTIIDNPASGDVTFEAPIRAELLRWLKHIVGGTPTSAQQAATPAYLHTFTMGALPTGLTVQKIMKDAADSTVATFSASGGKVTSAEFSLSVQQFLQLRVGLDFQKMVTSESAGTPSWSAAPLWDFRDATLKLDNAAAAQVLSFNFSVDNNLDTDRRFLGNTGRKDEPVSNGFRAVTGSVEVEFKSLADFYNAFANNTALDLDIEFVGDVISGVHSETLTITVPQIRLTGSTPTISGDGPIRHTVPFEGFYDGTNAPLTITAKTTDTAVP